MSNNPYQFEIDSHMHLHETNKHMCKSLGWKHCLQENRTSGNTTTVTWRWKTPDGIKTSETITHEREEDWVQYYIPLALRALEKYYADLTPKTLYGYHLCQIVGSYADADIAFATSSQKIQAFLKVIEDIEYINKGRHQ